MEGTSYRTERDGMGEIRVPANALWGAQTQRAVEDFPSTGHRMPREALRALGWIKCACATVNGDLGILDEERAGAIREAALEVADGRHDAHFPVEVFQTGSGTSTNMNANEVIACIASERAGLSVHPNDHVNMSQSSNDVIPTAIGVSACSAIRERLLPALERLAAAIEERAAELDSVVKTGRTHLMDALPIRLGQELGGWAAQIRHGIERVQSGFPRLAALPIGGTAVGTGLNAPESFGPRVVEALKGLTGIPFAPMENLFEGLSSQDAAVEMSGHLKTLAVSLMKVANDLRWMNSGPLAGLGEIALPALQPGSSIMPGKVNPVIPEAVAMACAQVVGNDATITIAGGSGSFQLNVMLPLIAYDLLESIGLLAAASRALAEEAIAGFVVRKERIQESLARNPILVTALTPLIGYEKGAAIARRAYAEGRPILEVAREMSGISEEDLSRLLDPARLTRGGRVGPER
jgi:fumarate hydratase class II